MRRGLVALALYGALASTTAIGAVTVHTSAFISTPIASTGFDGLELVPVNTSHVSGGLQVEYVEPLFTDALIGFHDDANNAYWYAVDYNGYFSIKLADGSAFNQVQFRGGSGGQGGLPYQYSLRLNGVEVANGLGSNVPQFGPTFADLTTVMGLSGISFDEVRLRLDEIATKFELTTQDVLAMDDLVLGREAVDAVPEPATWALLVAGFAAVGAASRKRRTVLA